MPNVRVYEWLPPAVLLAVALGAAAGISGPLPFVLIVGALAAYAILRFPRESAVVLLVLTPFYDTAMVRLGPADIRLLEVAWAAVIAAMLIHAAAGRPVRLARVPSWAIGLTAAVVLWDLAALQFSVMPARSAVEVAQTAYLGTVMLLGASVVSSLNIGDRVSAMKGAAYSFLAAFGITVVWRALMGTILPRIVVDQGGVSALGTVVKTQSAGIEGVLLRRFNLLTIGNVESAAIFAVVIAVGLAVILEERWREHRPLAILCVLLASGGMLLTYSRAGWVVVLVAVWLLGARLGLKKLAVTTVAMTGVAFLSMLNPAVSARVQEFGDITEGSFAVHLRMWLTSIYMASVRPLTGWGPGTFKHVGADLGIAVEVFPWMQPGEDAHNFILQAAAETGLVGASLVVALVASVLVASFRGALRTGSLVAYGFVVSATSVLLMDMTQNGFRTEITWVTLGIAFAAWLDATRQSVDEETEA